MGNRQSCRCGHHNPIGVRRGIHSRDHSRGLRIASAGTHRSCARFGAHADAMRGIDRDSADGLARFACSYRPVRKHHQGFIAAFGDCCDRAYTDNARDQRYKLQFLRMLFTTRRAVSLYDATDNVREQVFREEAQLRRVIDKALSGNNSVTNKILYYVCINYKYFSTISFMVSIVFTLSALSRKIFDSCRHLSRLHRLQTDLLYSILLICHPFCNLRF